MIDDKVLDTQGGTFCVGNEVAFGLGGTPWQALLRFYQNAKSGYENRRLKRYLDEMEDSIFCYYLPAGKVWDMRFNNYHPCDVDGRPYGVPIFTGSACEHNDLLHYNALVKGKWIWIDGDERLTQKDALETFKELPRQSGFAHI